MNDLSSLSALLAHVPEHPVPHAGDAVRLDYAPDPRGVAVSVRAAADGTATLTVTAPADEVERSVSAAQAAIVRSHGGDPRDAQAFEQARARMGIMAFANAVNRLVRQRLFSLAVMLTGILPFFAPRYLEGAAPRPGEPYTFEVEVLLRPASELSTYEPARVSLPATAPVTEDDVEQALGAMLGGSINFTNVPDEARASFDRLRDEARSQLEAQRASERTAALIDRATDALAERLVSQPPQGYVELMRNQMANQFAASVEASGTPWDSYTADPSYNEEAFKASMTAQALQALRRGMVLDAVTAHEGIRLTLDDVLAALGSVARGRETVAAQAMLDNGQLPQLCEVALRAKAGEWVARHAEDAAGEKPSNAGGVSAAGRPASA